VIRLALLLPALLLIAGCESLNEAFVRQMYTDHGISRRIEEQIREGLEKRKRLPATNIPASPAPSFFDQG